MRRLERYGAALVVVLVLSATLSAAPPGPFFNVVDFGAVGDGATNNTEAFAQAIAACAQAGGGTVIVPAGRFVSGAITLKSNITFHVVAGATILGSQKIEDFPLVDGRWEGIEQKHYASLINGDGLENIAITGRGTLDARGKIWWDLKREKKLDYARGRLIGLYRCHNVLIEGLTLRNSPAWTVNPIYCEDVTITNLTVLNPSNSPNTDGINPDSSRNVRISNCHIDVGDDCITIKSGRNEDGRRVGKPCENITVTNCTMLRGHGGVVIGSEMSGGVNNVTITNCVFDGTDNGIRMKTMRGRGGVVQDIRVSNIVMRNVGRALKLNMHYHSTPDEPVSERTPAFRNIHISGITVHGAKEAGYFRGLPEMPLSDVSLTNAVMHAQKGIRCTDAKNIALRDVEMNTEEGPALHGHTIEDLEIDNLKTRTPHEDAAVIDLTDVRQVFVRQCRAIAGTGTFFKVSGEETADVWLHGNCLRPARDDVVLGDGVERDTIQKLD